MNDLEKLTLLMVAEIHEHLGIKHGIDPKFVKEALCSGNAWALRRKYATQAYASEDKTDEEVDQVYDVLDMWRFLEDSYDKLPPPEKKKVEEANSGPVRMHGFDAHEDQLGIACFIIDHMEHYPELKGRADVDCHHSVKGAYARMVSVFNPIRRSLGATSRQSALLTADEILSMLAARRGD
jgi:uncharacterized protein